MKRLLLLFVCVAFLSSCTDPINVEEVCPNFLTGNWVTKASPANQDTILNFLSTGRYNILTINFTSTYKFVHDLHDLRIKLLTTTL